MVEKNSGFEKDIFRSKHKRRRSLLVKLLFTSVDYSGGKHLSRFLFKRQEDIDLNQDKADVGDIVKRCR